MGCCQLGTPASNLYRPTLLLQQQINFLVKSRFTGDPHRFSIYCHLQMLATLKNVGFVKRYTNRGVMRNSLHSTQLEHQETPLGIVEFNVPQSR